MKNLKVALVHDWLTGQRGGEKVLEVLCEIFPEAPIFTLFHFPGSQREAIEEKEIFTSFLQKMPFLRRKYRSYLPLFPLAAELFDLQDFDMVVSSSHCVAKGIIPRPDALHVCYIHSPVRYAWNQYFAYFSPQKLGFFSRKIIPFSIHKLRLWDESSSHRVDHFIANSKTTSQRVQKYYRRQSDVIHPPVDTEFFQPDDQQEDYFLIVSALVPYKKIELAIQTFNKNGKVLKIVGQGPEYRRLKKISKTNIQFLGSIDENSLRMAYQRAKALIMPGEEDFGINALEAQACGIPVVSYARGGALETVIAGETGVFFHDLSADSLSEALGKLESLKFDKKTIRSHAQKYSREKFKEYIYEFLEKKWNDFTSQPSPQ
ncbi:MAG: glycosyltransferase [Candidatus Aminicenantes bacterium]|nr:glycosyltransferase [Candidatus Aminicenantes bacterium]